MGAVSYQEMEAEMQFIASLYDLDVKTRFIASRHFVFNAKNHVFTGLGTQRRDKSRLYDPSSVCT